MKIKDGGIICGHDFEVLQYLLTEEEYIEQDYYQNAHRGVIKAVFDHFGTNIELRYASGGQSPHIPVWIKKYYPKS